MEGIFSLLQSEGTRRNSISLSHIDFENFVNDYGPSYQLFLGIGENNHVLIKHLLSNGVDVNTRIAYGITPLMWAAHSCTCTNIIQTLLTNGARVNDASVEMTTALHYASSYSSVEVVKELINSGACVNAKGPLSGTALHYACECKKPDVVNILCEFGADVNACASRFGQKNYIHKITPLHVAATRCVNSVKILIQNEADINARTDEDATPLHFAAYSGHCDIVELLLDANCDVNALDYRNSTPLLNAVEQNHVKTVKLLIARGANVNAGTNLNVTPLHMASGRNYLKIVKILLASNANINAKLFNGSTPLCIAVYENSEEVVEYLLENGANVMALCDERCTLLHVSAQYGSSLDIVKTLIKKGGKVNATNLYGSSPLHLAVCKNNFELSCLLIEHGADCNLADERTMTPLHFASSQGHLKIVKFLIKKKAYVNIKTEEFWTPLHFAANNGHLKVIKVLLDNGAEVNSLDFNRWTALHFAALGGFNLIVLILLDSGADYYIRDRKGYNPLYLAAIGHFEIVKILVSRGADVNSKLNDGAMPLHRAAQYGSVDIVKYLLMNGAKFDSRINTNNCTALQIALKFPQNVNVIKLLKVTELMFYSIKSNNVKELDMCLKDGAYVNTKSVKHGAPIILAAHHGAIEAAELLILNKADVNMVLDSGCSPLHYAAKSDHFPMVCLLLRHGAIHNIKCVKKKRTPLQFSVKGSATDSLLQTISALFAKIEERNFEVVQELTCFQLKFNQLAAIAGAHNEANKTLINLCELEKEDQAVKKVLSILNIPNILPAIKNKLM